ncbi:MAG: hypothetical protein QOG80_2400, partial [Pseudonocardiales bacterium]|nr:hypothetical protein [Pseudonocardiales bacterium]
TAQKDRTDDGAQPRGQRRGRRVARRQVVVAYRWFDKNVLHNPTWSGVITGFDLDHIHPSTLTLPIESLRSTPAVDRAATIETACGCSRSLERRRRGKHASEQNPSAGRDREGICIGRLHVQQATARRPRSLLDARQPEINGWHLDLSKALFNGYWRTPEVIVSAGMGLAGLIGPISPTMRSRSPPESH